MAEKVVAIKVELEGTSQQNKKLSQLELSLKELTDERKRLNKAVKEGTISNKKWAQSISQVNTKIKGTRTELNKTRNGILGLTGFTDKLGSKFNQLGTSISGAFLGLFAVQKFFDIIQDGIKTLEEFELQMAKVAAVTGATDAEVKALSESAKELGRTSQFTATEVGQLQEEFAKLGFTTEEILAASEATLQLATATGSDLAQSATVAASTLNAFGLEATETQRVVDVMAKSFTSSSLDINKFQNSINKVAPVAKAVGVGLEDTTASLGILSDAGFRAETAGTGLRNIFLEVEKRGITVEEAFNKILTSTDKASTAVGLFGKENAAVAITLAESQAATAALSGELIKAEGSAAEMAKIVGDTAVGASKRLESAWEGLTLSLGDGTEDGLAKAKNSIAGFINDITDLNNSVNDLDSILESGFERYARSFESQARAVASVRKEREFLNKNLKNQNELEIQLQRNVAKLKVLQDGLSQAQKEENEDLEDFATLQIRVLEQSNKAIAAQVKELKESKKVQAATAERIEVEQDLAKIKVDLTTLSLEELKKLRTEESKAEIKRRKEAQKTAKEIANSDAKIAEQTRRLKQEQLVLEIRDKRDAEFQKLSFAEENAIREVELSVSSEKEKVKAIRAIQDKFLAERNALAERNREEDAKKAEEDAKKAASKKQKEEKERDEKEKEDRESLREQQLMFAQETADLLAEISTARVERQKSVALSNLNAQLEQGLINQEEFEKQRLKIEEKAFQRQKRIDIAQAIANGAVAITKTIAQLGGLGAITPLGAASLALIGAQTSAQVGIISSQKFEDGGILSGASHDNGGIPFTVNGVGGFEAEGGEAIINKKSTAMFAPLLSAINQAGGGVSFAKPSLGNTYFAEGGVLNRSNSLDVAGLRDEITQAVIQSVGAIQVVNNATDTVSEAARVNNIISEASFG
jgi:hypothetical protein